MSKQQMPLTKSFTLSNTGGREELCARHTSNSWKLHAMRLEQFSLRVDAENGIGGAVARSPLPHHPTCGSASGGSEGHARPSNSRGRPRESKYASGSAMRSEER